MFKFIRAVMFLLVLAGIVLVGFYIWGSKNPSVRLSVQKADASGWDIIIQAKNFIIGESAMDGANGHAHLYVDGTLISLLHKSKFHIGALPSGAHTIKVGLNTFDHTKVMVGGKPVEDTVAITSAENGTMPAELMMQGYGGGSMSTSSKVSVYQPVAEVYTTESWKSDNLMVIIEKNRGGVALVDGSTNKLVGRISGLGEQPHTIVFSPDGHYGYLISRDGWLSKIDLVNIKVAASKKVGESSRGTAITKSGKYIAVGNYEPNTLVILDANTLDIVSKVTLQDTRVANGKESRAGVVLDNGEKFVVALKDMNSVWVIDTAQKDFPVVDRFWDVGAVGSIIDGYVTSDDRYLVFSIDQSNVVWVLDAQTMEKVTEIKTGMTPHTGPGANWRNLTFIPAIMEGRITVVDTNTWKLVNYITTGQPSQFARAYPGGKYPYIWIDTFQMGKSDELYIIDARTQKIVETKVPLKSKMVMHPEFTYDGKYVYVSMVDENQIYIYDAYSFKLVGKRDVDSPTGIFNVGLRTKEPGL